MDSFCVCMFRAISETRVYRRGHSNVSWLLPPGSDHAAAIVFILLGEVYYHLVAINIELHANICTHSLPALQLTGKAGFVLVLSGCVSVCLRDCSRKN